MNTYHANERLIMREASENKLILESYPRVVTLGLTVRCNINVPVFID
ncbi:hypothetical protein JXQ70_00075 [bacterium]|nr:hypothetical protein [bacterium]